MDYDSGDDLFITQSNFRTVETQEAAEAVDFLDTSFPFDFADDLLSTGDTETAHSSCSAKKPSVLNDSEVLSCPVDCTAPLNDVKTSEGVSAGEKAATDEGASGLQHPVTNVVVGQEPFIALEANLDLEVDEDALLSAALDDAMQDIDRFGEPVSDETVQSNSGKGYVLIMHISYEFFFLFKHIQVWSQIEGTCLTCILRAKKLLLLQADFWLYLILCIFW